MARIVFGAFWAFVGFVLCGTGMPSATDNAVFTGQMVAGLLMFVIGGGFIISGVKKRKKKKQEEQERAKRRELGIQGIQWKAELLHTNGLPLAENTKCSLVFENGQLTMTGAGQQFTLAADKITDISITTDREIQKSYTSSVGGAVGGAVLFGPLGAMIGGRAKEKQSTVVTNYLIITYQSDGEVKYIGFNLQNYAHSVIAAKKLCKLFSDSRPSQGQNSTIEL